EMRRDGLAAVVRGGWRCHGDGGSGAGCSQGGSDFHGGGSPSPPQFTLPRSRTKYQKMTKLVDHRSMPKLLQLELDRTAKTPLAEQIRNGISNAIETGVLASGARLPSWQDLAAQLGVARGTVRSAYEKLSAGQLIVASRATGTHVAA